MFQFEKVFKVFFLAALTLVTAGCSNGLKATHVLSSNSTPPNKPPAEEPPADPPTGPVTGSSTLTAIWANNGEDKIVKEEIRGTQNPAGVVNSVWDGAKVKLFG